MLSLLFGDDLFYKSRALDENAIVSKFIPNTNTKPNDLIDFTQLKISKENSKSFLKSLLIAKFIFKHDDLHSRQNIVIETENNNIKSARVIDFDKKFAFNEKIKNDFDVNNIKKSLKNTMLGVGIGVILLGVIASIACYISLNNNQSKTDSIPKNNLNITSTASATSNALVDNTPTT